MGLFQKKPKEPELTRLQKNAIALAEAVRAVTAQAPGPVIVAIDGRSCTGKTALSALVAEELGCPVFHMDDFFLESGKRTRERLDTPGGTVDHERFRAQVLEPFSKGQPVELIAYDCHKKRYLDPVSVPAGPLALVEGCYSLLPPLRPYYAKKVLLTIPQADQLCRLSLREPNPVRLRTFASMWLPLEELYFSQTDAAACADMTIENTDN